MRFFVYYSDGIHLIETIHAKNAKAAAIKLLQKIPRDDDCNICVEAKEFSNKIHDRVFHLSDLLPEIKKLEKDPLKTILDKIDLTSFDVNLVEEIILRHPDWINYIKANEKEDYIVEIHIPCPTNGNPSIDIIIGEGDSPVIGFGPGWIDSYGLSHIAGISWIDWDNPTLYSDAIEIFVEEIVAEHMITAEISAGIFKKYSKRLLIECDQYEKLASRGKIIRSISWFGKFNYNYDCEWTI